MEPDDETLRHLESRAKVYAEEKKKQQLDVLEKGIVDAKAKLEAAKAKAAKKNPKDKKESERSREESREPTPEEIAVTEAERALAVAEKAKARVEEAPPEVQKVQLLDKVFEDIVQVEDVSSGTKSAAATLLPQALLGRTC